MGIRETRRITGDYVLTVDDWMARRSFDDEIAPGSVQRVSVDPTQRGGLLGMAGVHVATSYPLRTSAVLRGKWILESLLGGDMPPAPADVPALDVDEATVTVTSVRERLEQHRKNPDCAACHNRMDPLGFGLENFDALGRWRDAEGGQKIDAGEPPWIYTRHR